MQTPDKSSARENWIVLKADFPARHPCQIRKKFGQSKTSMPIIASFFGLLSGRKAFESEKCCKARLVVLCRHIEINLPDACPMEFAILCHALQSLSY